MSVKRSIILFIFLLLLAALFAYVLAQPRTEEKLSTRYATVLCKDDTLLRLFNRRIRLGTLDYLLKRGSEELSLEGQVSQKVDVIVERVETILEMRPKNFRVVIVVVPSSDDIRSIYRRKYRRDVDFLAFYSPIEKAVYISADDAKSNILAHEIAHAVIDQYFGVAAPAKIHELLADYVSENFEE